MNTPFSRLQDQVIDALLRAFSPVRRACARAERLISLNADGEASEAERLEISAHLERCPACRAIENATLLVRAGLRERPRAAMPDALAARLSAAIEGEQRRERVDALEQEQKRRVFVPRLRLAGGSAVGIASLVLLAAIFHHQQPQTVTPIHPVAPIVAAKPGSPSQTPTGPSMADNTHQTPITVATNTPAHPRSARQNAAIEAAMNAANARAQAAQRPEIVAELPKPDTSVFPHEPKTTPAAVSARPKAFHAGIGLSSHTHSPGPGSEVEIATAQSHTHSDHDGSDNNNNNNFAPPIISPQPAANPASTSGDQTSEVRVASVQSNLSGVLRNIVARSEQNERQTTIASVAASSFSTHPADYTGSVSLVAAEVH